MKDHISDVKKKTFFIFGTDGKGHCLIVIIGTVMGCSGCIKEYLRNTVF